MSSKIIWLVFLLLAGFLLLRTLFEDAGFQRVPYSRIMDRIRSDGCERVVVGTEWVKCYSKGEDPGQAGLPWFAVRVQGDSKFVPLLDQKHLEKDLEYEAVSDSSLKELMWMAAIAVGIGIFVATWFPRRST